MLVFFYFEKIERKSFERNFLSHFYNVEFWNVKLIADLFTSGSKNPINRALADDVGFILFFDEFFQNVVDLIKGK